MTEQHINLEQLTPSERVQQALSNQGKLTKDEVTFLKECEKDLADDGQLENHRHYTILRNLWKKSLGLTA